MISNTSIETIIGNIARQHVDKPGNQLVVSWNKLEPTPHPLIDLVDDIDYTDQGVLDIFQHGYLEHVHIGDSIHGFKNIVPNGRYHGEVIWCTGSEHAGIISDMYDLIKNIPQEDRESMNIDLINCGMLLTWSEVITLVRNDESQLRIGCVSKPNTIYHIGVDTYKKLSMKITREIPTPMAFSGLDFTERLWFIYKGMQPSVRISNSLRSYRIVYL